MEQVIEKASKVVPLFGDMVHMRSSGFLVAVVFEVVLTGEAGEDTVVLLVALTRPGGVLLGPPVVWLLVGRACVGSGFSWLGSELFLGGGDGGGGGGDDDVFMI